MTSLIAFAMNDLARPGRGGGDGYLGSTGEPIHSRQRGPDCALGGALECLSPDGRRAISPVP
jgi:hypothetical protein